MFDLQAFVDHPTVEQFERCRKDDLLQIAAHFVVQVSRQSSKEEIKRVLKEKLESLQVLVVPVQAEEESDGSSVGAEPDVFEEPSVVQERGQPEIKASLPHFDPCSPASSSSLSKDEARLKVHLARVQMEAQDKALARQAEYDLKISIRKLEIEADKQVRLRELELQAMKVNASSAVQVSDATASTNNSPDSESSTRFDVSRHIALVPQFRETEVDTYFGAFERIAASLHWPKETWTLLLQCRLVGKAQEVCASLSIEESLNYDLVKAAILRAYELVPEAYRQRFRNHKKGYSQTFMEFAREKGILFDKWCSASKVQDFVTLRELVLLEDFKTCLSERLVVYLNEQKVTTLAQAAVLAD